MNGLRGAPLGLAAVLVPLATAALISLLIAGAVPSGLNRWLAAAAVAATLALSAGLGIAAARAAVRTLRSDVETRSTLTHSERLLTLREAGLALAAERELEAAWPRVPALAARLTDACHSLITVGPPGVAAITFAHAPDVDRGPACCPLAGPARDGRPPPALDAGDPLRLTVPLAHHGEPMGTLHLSRPFDAAPFDPFDDSIARVFAGEAALVLTSAQLIGRGSGSNGAPDEGRPPAG